MYKIINEIVANEDFLDGDYGDINRIFKENGFSDSYFDDLVTRVSNNGSILDFDFKRIIIETFISNKEIIFQIIAICIISLFITLLGKNIADSTRFIISIITMIFLIAAYYSCLNTTISCLNNSIGLFTAIIPIFFPLVGLTSGVTASAAYYEIVMSLMYAVNLIIKNIMLKLNTSYFMLGMIDTIKQVDSYTKICSLISRLIRISGKCILGFFLGLNGIKGLILPLKNNISMSVLFKVVSCVPGIGDSAQTVSKTVLGSANLAKNTIGVAGIIALLSIVLVPLLKLLIIALCYQFISGILEPVADKRIVNATHVLGEGLMNLTYMIIIITVLLSLTFAIICYSTTLSIF